MFKFKLSSGMKTAILILNEIFALMLITVILLTSNYGSNRGSWEDLLKHRTYEESNYFQTQSINQTTRALRAATRATRFEKYGVYDPDRLVNIEEYAERGVITGERTKDKEGVYYRLADLLDWAQEGYTFSEVTIYSDGQMEFQLEDSPGREELAEDLGTYFGRSGAEWNAYYQYYSNVAGSWSEPYEHYKKQILNEKYHPIGYRNLVEYAVAVNGNIGEIYEWMEKTLENIVSDVISYRDNINIFSEEESNVRYFLIDRENEQVYTNTKYRKASEQEIKAYVKSFGAYCIYDNLELSVDTENIGLSVTELYGYVEKYGYSGSEDYALAVAIDTKYPAQDVLYSGYERYQKLQPIAQLTMVAGGIGIIGYFLTFLILSIKTGEESGAEGVQLIWFDYWKTEVSFLVILLLASVGAVPLYLLNDYFSFLTEEGLVGFVALGENLVFLTGWLSLLRRAKAKLLWKNSVTFTVVHMIKDAFGNSRRTTKALAVFIVYLAGSLLLLQFGVQFFIIFNIAAGFFIVREAVQDQKLLDGMKKLEEGDLDYRYETEDFSGFRKEFAEALNVVHQVFLDSVRESVKNERMQTDLITNVSHDIKTPLTSIINYVNLLKLENIENEKAKGYIDVLEQKSYRLKHLTEDLVEAAKISSGNITLECTQIQMQEMICQTGGEFADKFAQAGLHLIENLPKEPLYIKADGRRMWRVLENLYNNAAKYAMKNTRVYVDLLDMGDEVKFSIKNISEQRLNIEAEDLTERFIRGDISRSTEGSGLGLSIARNLTELQGGRFHIYLDGDLFRVTIIFPKLEPLPEDLSIADIEENLEAEIGQDEG